MEKKESKKAKVKSKWSCTDEKKLQWVCRPNGHKSQLDLNSSYDRFRKRKKYNTDPIVHTLVRRYYLNLVDKFLPFWANIKFTNKQIFIMKIEKKVIITSILYDNNSALWLMWKQWALFNFFIAVSQSFKYSIIIRISTSITNLFVPLMILFISF